MSYAIFALMCLAVTFVGAICGVGGGVILKPVLDAVSGYSVAQVGLLSGITVLAMTLSSVVTSREVRAELGRRRMRLFLVGSVMGGLMGKALLKALLDWVSSDALAGVAQNALLMALMVATLWYELNRWKIRTHRIERWWIAALIGALLGMVSTFLGIGGGPFNLIVLIHCFSMDPRSAAAGSLGIILFSQSASLVEMLATAGAPELPLPVLLLGAAGGVAGGLLGRASVRRMDERQIGRLFLGLLFAIIVICLLNIAKYASAMPA